MHRYRLVLLAACLPALGACVSTPGTQTGGTLPPQAVACNADAANDAIGKAATEAVVEQARLDAGAATVRVIKPGQAVTMDFRGDRLNVKVNARNAIEGLTCG